MFEILDKETVAQLRALAQRLVEADERRAAAEERTAAAFERLADQAEGKPRKAAARG